ncbi:Fip1-domain-containing protein [Wilcoxina mikolae CBS 423.85]|nr:Fip1-domain-containing protein [Wilcoxina mikolae CBS 423.85]
MSAMDQDDDEFLYGDRSSAPHMSATASAPDSSTLPGLSAGYLRSPPLRQLEGRILMATPIQSESEELEEGEEEEEEEVEVSDDDDDIELVIERKDGSRPEPPPRPERYNQIRTALPRPTCTAAPVRPFQATSPIPQASTAPVACAITTSKLDINAMPSYNGIPINKISMESDILTSERPWRKPGSDVSDYFNYGFDEFTWTAYCQKQEGLRDEFSPQKMMEQMMLMSGMGMGIIPGMDPNQMSDMGAMIGGAFSMQHGGPSGGGPNNGLLQAPGVGQPTAQGIDMMVDPSMYISGQNFDGRGGPQESTYGMGRGSMPPQGPAAGPMGAYCGFDQGVIQGARIPGAFGPRGGRAGRRW